MLIEERIATFPMLQLGQVMFYNEDSARIDEAVFKQPDPGVNLWDVFGNPADPKILDRLGSDPL